MGIAAVVISCSPFPARVRTDHAHEFHCDARYVQVSAEGEGRFRAVGCGIQSEWECRDRACRMRDHRAYGVDSP
jgi:hypothetical protein